MSRKRFVVLVISLAFLAVRCSSPMATTPEANTPTSAPMESTTPAGTSAPVETAGGAVEPTESVSPTRSWNVTNTPAPESQDEAVSSTTEPLETGPLSMIFVTDVTIPDGTVAQPGELLLKIWRVENTGETTWQTERPPFRLTFNAGDQLSGPSVAQALFYPAGVDLTLETSFQSWSGWRTRVEPGEQVDLPLLVRAPEAEGHYRGYWMLLDGEGGELGGLYVDIIVEEDGAPSGTWSGAWTQQDPYVTSACSGPLNLVQQDTQVAGFGYACDGRLLLVRGFVTEQGVVEGSFGLEGFVFPFTWVMLPGGNQFQGMYQDSAFSVGAWCGGRYGEEPPFENCMPAE